MSVRCSIKLSLDDFIAANLLYQKRYWIWSGLLKVFGLSTLTFFLLVLAITAIDEPLSWPYVVALLLGSLLFGLGMAVFMPILSLVVMRLNVKRPFRQLALGLPTDYEIDADGLRAANELGSSTLTWDRFDDFVQDRRLLLLRRSRRVFFILPRSQLSSETLEDILTCAREAGVRER